MSQKFLGIIQTFSQNQLIDFLRKNGHGEYEEIFVDAEITDGEKFLNINELQIIKWGLAPTEKRKLLAFLTEIKQNPQKFIGENERLTNVIRRQSLVIHNKKNIDENPQNFPGEKQTHVTTRQNLVSQNNFKMKLEQVIVGPKPCQIKPARKPAPPPKPIDEINDEDSLPTEDYLPMDRGGTENLDDHYDESGYLVPLDRSNPVEENDYEPPPAVHNFGFPNIGNTTPLAGRAPQTLPRGSTDERGYILQLKQEQPPPILPRVQQNQKNVSIRPKLDTPSPTVKAPPKFNASVQKDSESEEDEYDEPGDSWDNLASSETQNTGFNKFMSLFRKDKKNVNYENSDAISITSKESVTSKGSVVSKGSMEKIETPKQSSFTSKSLEREYKLKDRPLPPLPERNHNPPVQKNVQFTSAKIYVNVPQQTPSGATSNRKIEISTLHDPQAHAVARKSKSENDLSREDEDVIYNNADAEKEIKPKHAENYEHYLVQEQDGKHSKRPLPLPPRNLPRVQIDPSLLHNKCDDDEESDEYFHFIQNLNNELFYRNTDRKGARLLLTDLGEGAFLFRPSKQYFLTLSLKHNEKYFNLGIEKTSHNKIRLHTEGDNTSPEFTSLSEFADHFSIEYLTFEHQGRVVEVMLQKILPKNRF